VHTAAPPPPVAYTGTIKSITYQVPSASTPGTYYTVSVNHLNRRPQSCTCPARTTCWHQKLITTGVHTLRPHITSGPVIERSRKPAAAVPCALCRRTDTLKVGSGGYMGTDPDARICRDWTGCQDKRF
jgi:hypothetical protein